MKKVGAVLGVKDVAILLALGLISVGIGLYDWRAAMIVSGTIILGLIVSGVKRSGNNN